MKSDFLLYVIFHAFIIMKTYQIFCELHRSFVKSIDRILSDAETPLFVMRNDPDFFTTSIFFIDCSGRFRQMKTFQHPTIIIRSMNFTNDLWTSFHDNECVKYHIPQKLRFHSINWPRRSSFSH